MGEGGAGAIAAGGAALGPWGALAGAALGAAQAPPAGPSNALGGNVDGNNFDHSGWNVTFGDNSGIEATRSEQGELSRFLPYIVVGAAFLLGWRYLKKK